MEKNRNRQEKKSRFMGRVIKWNKEKNYGFVSCFEDEESYFCSGKVIGDEPYLDRGTIVDFEIGHGKDSDGKPSSFIRKLLVVEVPEERHTKY